jgi:2'-5' RNA ligase
MTVQLNRLFFALWPDDGVRKACVEAQRDLKLRNSIAGGKWTAPERLHMTLSFLGSALTAEQEAAVRAVAAGVQAPPFSLSLDFAGCFRGRQPPWWLGARNMPDGLTILLEQLSEGLRAARVLPDRERFAAHVTILRDAARTLPETAIRPIAWDVTDFVLVRSHLERQPAEYQVVGRWPLARPSSAQLDLWET